MKSKVVNSILSIMLAASMTLTPSVSVMADDADVGSSSQLQAVDFTEVVGDEQPMPEAAQEALSESESGSVVLPENELKEQQDVVVTPKENLQNNVEEPEQVENSQQSDVSSAVDFNTSSQDTDTIESITDDNVEKTDEEISDTNEITDIVSDETSGTEVSDSIHEVIEETREVALLNNEEREILSDKIEEIQETYQQLPEEQQDALSESMDALDNASVAVEKMQKTIDTKEKTGKVTYKKGPENSWRYINGQPIDEALETVEQESDVVEAIEDGESQAVIDALKEGTAKKITGDAMQMDSDAPDVILVATSKADGVDVSHHNGSINWATVKKTNIKYAILRCGYGSDQNSQDDRYWKRNVSECERLGIPYGVYLYSHALNTSQVDSEVAHTLRLLKGHKPQFPVYYDTEENSQYALSKSTLCNLVNRYCSKIQAAGYTTGIYASTSWWQAKYDGTSLVNNKSYGHWVAQYNTSCKYAGRVDMWQYTSNGHVNGISGRVDMNHWYLAMPTSSSTQTSTTTTTATVTVPKAKSIISSNINSAAGTFKVTLNGVEAPNGVKNVRFAAWSKSDQSDLAWYTATNDGKGNYSATVNIKNHKNNYGTYTVHAYIAGNSGNEKIFATPLSVKITAPATETPFAGKVAIGSSNANAGTFVANVTGVTSPGSVKEVKLLVYSKSDKSDQAWYTATKSGSTYSATVNINKHKYNVGTYTVLAYVYSSNGTNKQVSSATTKVSQTVGALTVKDTSTKSATKRSISTTFTNTQGMSLQFLVYDANTKNKVWYTPKASGNTYTAEVNITSTYKQKGTYTVEAYTKDASGAAHYINKTTFKVSSLATAKPVTKYKGVDYSSVYNYEYYKAKYSDLKKAFGNDDEKYLEHFVNHGMDEARQASKNFNVQNYRNRYSDLKKKYKKKWKKYYLHYINYGKKEGRNGK